MAGGSGAGVTVEADPGDETMCAGEAWDEPIAIGEVRPFRMGDGSGL